MGVGQNSDASGKVIKEILDFVSYYIIQKIAEYHPKKNSSLLQ